MIQALVQYADSIGVQVDIERDSAEYTDHLDHSDFDPGHSDHIDS
jgi:hypothetical protein